MCKHILKIFSPSGTVARRQTKIGYKKIAIFDQYLASTRAVNGLTIRCCKQNDTDRQSDGQRHRPNVT